ncbi:MAG: phosphoribosyltransferase family protein [Candidatus Asgardarchaeia archaeon]
MDEGWSIFLCSGAEHLKERLENNGLKVYQSGLNHDGKRFFPNTDLYTRVEDVEELSGKNVLVIQSATGSGDLDEEKYTTSDRLWETLQVLDILSNPLRVREVGHKTYEYERLERPKKVHVMYLFTPFALQDKAFKTGEVNSAKLSLELTLMKSDKVILIDPHPPRNLEWMSKLIDDGKVEMLTAVPLLIEKIREISGIDDFSIVGPDEGEEARVGIRGMRKYRRDSFHVEIMGDGIDAKGKNFIVIDDLTKSGSTLLKAREFLLKRGAKEVYCATTHVLPIIGRGESLLLELVRKLNRKFVTTNTIRTRTFEEVYRDLMVDVTQLILDYCRTR